MSDPINPSHYKHLPVEAIDIIMAAIAKAPSNESAYLQGQVLKYLLRCWSKKGIEDLRKAKWYLDRMVTSFDDLLAEASGANETPSDEPTTEPPDGWRWVEVGEDFRVADTLNTIDRIPGNWIGTACVVKHCAFRKIDPPPKRYREPTQADLANGPIDCEVRNSDGEPWVWRILCGIVDKSDRPFRVFRLKDRLMDSKAKWPQCRIEVAE
jgi:hypothetical protein